MGAFGLTSGQIHEKLLCLVASTVATVRIWTICALLPVMSWMFIVVQGLVAFASRVQPILHWPSAVKESEGPGKVGVGEARAPEPMAMAMRAEKNMARNG